MWNFEPPFRPKKNVSWSVGIVYHWRHATVDRVPLRDRAIEKCSFAARVWITHIMTRFTHIVSTASKPLRGRLNHQVPMMRNQVMMMVIHTHVLDKSALYRRRERRRVARTPRAPAKGGRPLHSCFRATFTSPCLRETRQKDSLLSISQVYLLTKRKHYTDVNLHVFSAGCPEIDRMLLFRNWLRSNASDRQLYERTKRELASKDWKYTQNYADAKTEVVEEILARARGDDRP